jgi:hypothetical protein
MAAPASIRPPGKKPWYLVLALFFALVAGSSSACEGYNVVAFYHGDTVDPAESPLVEEGRTPGDRALLQERLSDKFAAMSKARGRLFPLGVAALLVGIAMVLVALRAMAGRTGAHKLLVQLVVVEAALRIGTYALESDVRAYDRALGAAMFDVKLRQSVPEDEAARLAPFGAATLRVFEPIHLVLGTLGSALVVFALTRRRSRAFFEGATDPATLQ